MRPTRPSRGGARRARVWRFEKSPAKWLLATLVSLLIGGLISDHYSDRQRELELEADLITQISRQAITLFQDAQEASRADATTTQREQRDKAADDWVLASGSITPVFRVYYDGQDVSGQWDDYQSAMYDWAVLGCCTSGSGRSSLVEGLREYHEQRLGPGRPAPAVDPWAALDSTDPPVDVYQWLGLELLRGRGRLLTDLKEATPSLD